jgi:heme/copper-type cytochrome/quinol oxidase subunit 2
MGLHVPDVSGPDLSGLNLRLAQEPPGSMPGVGTTGQFHHPSVGPAQVQAEEIALLIFLVMISAGVMLMTESARRHQHVMPRARVAHQHDHDHHHHWRRFSVVAIAVAVLLILGLLLYPLIVRG